MATSIDREALYAAVWTEPVRVVAARFGISDVALKKACQRAVIPTPDRGYWTKREAGKAVVKATLPLRPPGLSPEVTFGDGGHWYRNWTREELLRLRNQAKYLSFRARFQIPTPTHLPPTQTIKLRHENQVGLQLVGDLKVEVNP